MSMRGSRPGLPPIAAVVTLALAACSPAPASVPASRAAAAVADIPTPAEDCGDPTASLRPEGVRRAPDALPAGSAMKAIRDRGYLRAGISADSMLFGYLDPGTGRPSGFEIDLLDRVSAALFGDPGHVRYRVVDEAEGVRLLQGDQIDVMARGVAMSCQLWSRVDLSTEYYQATQEVLVARDSQVRVLDDLLGQRVCAPAGSSWLANLEASPAHPIAVSRADSGDCLVSFQEGEVDAITADDVTLLGFTVQDPFAKIVPAKLGQEHYGLATSQAHPELVRFLNAILEALRSNGTWTLLYERWLGRFGPAPAPPPARYRD
jgi:polar amino acid transport system substrate-binding protein